MSRFAYPLFPALLVSVGFYVISGCSGSGSDVDPALVAQHRSRLLLSEEPDDVLTVVDVRETLLGEAIESHDDHADDDHDHADHDLEGGDDHADDDHDHADHDLEGKDDHDHADHDDHDVDAPSGPIEVVMVGQVGGLTNPWEKTQPDFPFATNQAALFLADPQAVVENEESGHSHAPGEECPFCAAHAANNTSLLAMVRFVDESGNVLRIDVRNLFDVKEKDTVVVRGTARVVEGGMMMVDATGLYIRR